MSKYTVEDISLGYAPVPPEMLFYRPKVTEAEMKTWCVFALHRDLASGETHVGAMTVAEILGVDRTTVGRAVEGLKKKGFLLDLGRERDRDTGRLGVRKFAVAVGGKRVKVGLVRHDSEADSGQGASHDAQMPHGEESEPPGHDADLQHGEQKRASVHKTHDASHDAAHDADHDASHDASVHHPIQIEEDLRRSKEIDNPSGGVPADPANDNSAQMHENEIEPGEAEEARPTGGMYVRFFDEDLAEFREVASVPPEERCSLSGKWRKNLKRAADAELESGRDPQMIRKGISRLALRIDSFPGMELAEAINDVRSGKPWNLEQQERARRLLSGSQAPRPISGDEGAARRREGYEWLFGEDDSEEETPGPRETREDRRRREENERRQAEVAYGQRLKLAETEMRKWRSGMNDQTYQLQVTRLKRAHEENGLDVDDVERLDEEIRSEHAQRKAG